MAAVPLAPKPVDLRRPGGMWTPPYEHTAEWPKQTPERPCHGSSLGPWLGRLPVEIRRSIWGYVLYNEQGIVIGEPEPEDGNDSESDPATPSTSNESSESSEIMYESEDSDAEDTVKLHSYPLLSPIILASQWIYDEALPVMLEVNTIRLRETSKSQVSSNTWLLAWLEKRKGLCHSVWSIDFLEFSVTKELYDTDELNPDAKLMELCTNLKHVTVHLDHYHYSLPRRVPPDEDRMRWALVYKTFEQATDKWCGENAAQTYARKESERLKDTYQLNLLGQVKTLKRLEIVPSAIHYRKQKGKMADFFKLVNENLLQSFRQWLGPHTQIVISPCRAMVSCNHWVETISVLRDDSNGESSLG